MPDQDERDVFVAFEEARGKPRSAALPNINFCGDIGLKIGHDGTWYYQGSPILRPGLVKLFASVLRQEDNGAYFLVTPVERVSIEVEGAPFVAVEMSREGSGEAQRLSFRTNVDDVVTADGEHPLGFETGPRGSFIPFVVVRGGLRARLARPVYYELAALAVEAQCPERAGVWSGGVFFPFPATSC